MYAPNWLRRKTRSAGRRRANLRPALREESTSRPRRNQASRTNDNYSGGPRLFGAARVLLLPPAHPKRTVARRDSSLPPALSFRKELSLEGRPRNATCSGMFRRETIFQSRGCARCLNSAFALAFVDTSALRRQR